MKTLIFNGSPAKKGNTAALIDELCATIEGDVKVVDCYRVNVKACIDCKYCFKNAGCSIKDDMQQIYEDVEAADVIVMATPMHFGICSAPMFTVVSRLQSYWAQRNIRKLKLTNKEKLGALLVTCGNKWLNMELVMDGLMALAFDHMGIDEVVGDVYAKCTDDHPAKDNEAVLMKTRRLAQELNRRILGE